MNSIDLKTTKSNSNQQDRKIPLYLLEEHNEAFPVWINTIKRYNLPKGGYTLLHFDDHSDMTTLRVNTPLKEVFKWSDQKLKEFSRDELTIASFIKAAAFLGVFKEIVWCKVDVKYESSNKFFITSYNNDYKNLLSGYEIENNSLLEFDHEIVKYSQLGIGHIETKLFTDVFLDIDLDYFSCNVQPENNQEIILEVTMEEYLNFNKDSYHPIRFISNSVISKCIENSYYLIINYYHDILPSPRKVTEAVIDLRIDKFFSVLKKLDINPQLITICRSVKSGYTPFDQFKYIESSVLKGLNNLYNIAEPSKYNSTL